MATMNELIVNQDSLSNVCDTIEIYQNELDQNITHLTSGLEEEWNHINAQGDDQSLNSCDVDRENTFTLVTQLEYQLLKMQNRVTSMNNQYAQATNVDSGSSNANNTIPQIVDILDHFQSSIDHLSSSSKNLQKEVSKIKSEFF